MKKFPIGFHLGPGGNPTGIGDWMHKLDDAGIAFYLKSADTFGPVGEGLDIAIASGIPSTFGYRMTTDGQGDGYDYDVPKYGLDPDDAAFIHWQATVAMLPPEYKYNTTYKQMVWLEVINEVDQNRGDWLGRFCHRVAKLADEQGYKVALPSWSPGEPERDVWLEYGMAEFLRYAAGHPSTCAIAVHEYSLDRGLLFVDYPYHLGRIEALFSVCDELGIAKPTVMITEFGWTYNHVPVPIVAIPELERAANYYYQFPNVLGAGIWYLGPKYEGIADKAQKLIEPVGTLALAFDYDHVEPPPSPPQGGDNMFRNGSFEDGTYKWHGIDNMDMANEWEFWHADDTLPNPIDPNPWSTFARPLAGNPVDDIVIDGNKSLNIYKAGSSIYFKVYQNVTLGPGTSHLISMPVFADLVKGFDLNGEKVWADDPEQRDGLYKMYSGQAPTQFKKLVPGQWNYPTLTVSNTTSVDASVTVAMEIMLPFALAHNGVYLDMFEMNEFSAPPPASGCEFDDAFTKYHILRPRTLSTSQWEYIRDLMEIGIPASDLGVSGIDNIIIGYEGWSHVDALLAIKRALLAGYTSSRLIVVDGHLIGTGLDEAWMQANCATVAPYTVFLRSDGSLSPFKFTHWPTEYRKVNLKNLFGDNPSDYFPFSLPGHDGNDIRAYEGTDIYTVADGVISDIHPIEGTHSYGIFIRVMHKNNYETTYAHMQSILPSWTVGDPISGGSLLGYADNTGNSYGHHLHLTLKRHGHPYTDDVSYPDPWPYDIQDPTPFLKRLCLECFTAEPKPPAATPALLGLHATADPALAAGELAMMQAAGVEVVKMLSNIRKEDAGAIGSTFPDIPIIIRAFLDFGGRDVSPREFFDWTYPDVRDVVSRVGLNRVVLVELHNEPNLFAEGLGSSWSNGTSFNDWLLDVLTLYRQALGGVQFLYPGLSPGGSVQGIRIDHALFLEQSINAAQMCDAVGVHNYWSSAWPMSLALSQLEVYTSRLGSKPMWVTEASNNKGDTPSATKGSQYIQYVLDIAQQSNFKGVTYFVASASNPDWGSDGSGEVWLNTDIPSVVGSR